MMWSLRAHPDWRRRDARVQCEEHEAEEACEPRGDHGGTEC
ncbi:hypothetical protein B005_2399 [Nocardiopsis alba ATCC BAA-2165]|uniref:Uncharacterized protein n=1 Tax=Nocardiopsis alba (strain ATCC BAA-2165 / BE74) TaxID=1205910 RepID=J7LF89_NOCAA|nr:hypothetical protein B005_2399 [Nocardiopsis alba ATCC BAA-2165]